MRTIEKLYPSVSLDYASNRQRIRMLRYGLPLALYVVATAFEAWEHWAESAPFRIDSLGMVEVLIFGVAGPFAVYLTLTYVERLVQTVHQAHTRIAQLNEDLEQKVAERTAELQQANLRLREIDRMKSDFVSLVSHELRAPLTTLNGGLEAALQNEAQLPPKAQRILHLLVGETARLTGFVQTLLDVSQLEAGKLPLNFGPVAVKPLLTHAVDVVFGPDETRVVWQVPSETPPVWVDETYTEQVFRNLLRNAQKYTPPQSPLVVEVVVRGRQLCVCLTDYGPGIPSGLQEQVFERFRRVPSSDSDRPRGWGLGLHLARALAEAQGGALTLQSPVHADPAAPGSRFVITLPIAEEPLADEEEGDKQGAYGIETDRIAVRTGDLGQEEANKDGAPPSN